MTSASSANNAHCDLVIVGSGMAAARLVDALRKRGDRRSIALLGAERSLPYNRIMLSPLLAGETDWQQLITRPAEWYEQQSIELRLGAAAVDIDRARKIVRCTDGAQLHYDELVFATGSRAALPPLPGIELPGVLGFRNFDDVTALQHASAGGGDAVVLGGGLLGLEAAVALAARGMNVTLVHRSAQLMNRQLDALAATYLQRAIEKRGVTIRTGVAPAKILGSVTDDVSHPVAVELANGERIPAQLVVAATGITPVTEVAQQCGLAVNHGIVVDRAMRTSDASIFAIGECNELDGETVGLVAPIWQQVDVLAANLCGEAKQFQQLPYVTMLKVSGIDVHVMGDLEAKPDASSDQVRVLTYQDRGLGIYKKLVLRNRTVAGALLFGDVADSQLFFNLIQRQSDVGRNYCQLLLAGICATELLATA